ncbi:MAG: hypothetical protein KBG30_10150 [Bacteroidales bacterium]|nr:hypothetical protein [Bacteroidales bacterium]
MGRNTDYQLEDLNEDSNDYERAQDYADARADEYFERMREEEYERGLDKKTTLKD